MKGGSILCWRTVVGVVGSTSPGAALRPSANVGLWESGAEWPCSVGIRSERVEAVGAAGRTTWIAVVGLADETSARRGSAVYPSFARLGASRPPQHVQVETTCRRVGEPHRTAVWLKDGVRILERVNFGKKITGGSKLFGRKITQALTFASGKTVCRLLWPWPPLLDHRRRSVSLSWFLLRK
ncbi:MAG: hypothetical protein ACJ8CB_35780, partial [Ktedonobacteraceae bacterium]